MNALALAWYGWLKGLTQGTVVVSPCQLTTNLSALAYASTQPARGRPFLLGVAYVAGKVSL